MFHYLKKSKIYTMDTSVTIIGLVITLLIAIPLYFIFKSNAIQKKRILSIQAIHNPKNKYNFAITENQNKKVYSIDTLNQAFLFMDFHPKEPFSKLIELNTISSCEIKYIKDVANDLTKKIELYFISSTSNIKESITVYNAEYDLINQICEHEDGQLAKKWKKIIDNCLTH
jgi:hypothetical protein